MTHANEGAHEQECDAPQVLRAFRALEQGMPIAGRHITREVNGSIEIGRDCPLVNLDSCFGYRAGTAWYRPCIHADSFHWACSNACPFGWSCFRTWR